MFHRVVFCVLLRLWLRHIQSPLQHLNAIYYNETISAWDESDIFIYFPPLLRRSVIVVGLFLFVFILAWLYALVECYAMKIIRPGERKAALNDTFVVVVFCAFASMSILLLTNIASMKTVESDTMKNKDDPSSNDGGQFSTEIRYFRWKIGDLGQQIAWNTMFECTAQQWQSAI